MKKRIRRNAQAIGEKMPITFEEIGDYRDHIQVGQKIRVREDKFNYSETRQEQVRRTYKVIGKEKRLLVCSRKVHGTEFIRCVLYIDLILGDGAWLA